MLATSCRGLRVLTSVATMFKPVSPWRIVSPSRADTPPQVGGEHAGVRKEGIEKVHIPAQINGSFSKSFVNMGKQLVGAHAHHIDSGDQLKPFSACKVEHALHRYRAPGTDVQRVANVDHSLFRRSRESGGGIELLDVGAGG